LEGRTSEDRGRVRRDRSRAPHRNPTPAKRRRSWEDEAGERHWPARCVPIFERFAGALAITRTAIYSLGDNYTRLMNPPSCQLTKSKARMTIIQNFGIAISFGFSRGMRTEFGQGVPVVPICRSSPRLFVPGVVETTAQLRAQLPPEETRSVAPAR
jgi:hypothetical protein